MKKKRHDQVVVQLKRKDKKDLEEMLRKGKTSVREVRRAMVLRLMDQGKTAPAAAAAMGVHSQMARYAAKRYSEGGLSFALRDKPRPGQRRVMSVKEENRVIAMVCASPPDGYARWTIVLIVEEAIKRGIVHRTNRERIRLLLQEHGLKPWQKKNVVYRGANAGIH